MRIVLITGITSTKPWNTQRQAIIKSGASSLVQSARRRHHVASLYRMDRPRQFLPPSQPTVSTPDACAKSSFGAPLGVEVALGSVPRPRALSDFEVGWGGRIRTYGTQAINDCCRSLEVGQRLGRRDVLQVGAWTARSCRCQRQ